MSDRLAELHRQRALVQTHLAWLDHEIAGEAARPAATARPPAPTPAARAAALTPVEGPDEVLRRYAPPPEASAARTRLGCWVAFVGALLALGAGLAAWSGLRAR